MKISHERKTWLSLVTTFLVVVLLIFISPELLPRGLRWYYLNPRYTLWIHGHYHYNKRIVWEGLNGDMWRDDVVRGKTVPELRTMFTDIREISQFKNYDLTKVTSLTNSTCTFVKWGDTDWFIEITNVVGNSISLWKG
jgi:hypothetical protein